MSELTTARSIIEMLKHKDEATPSEIADWLGPGWRRGNKSVLLRQTLRRMVHSRRVVKPRRGVYRLSPFYKRRGLSAEENMRDKIVEFLRGCGGIARTRDILAFFEARRGYEKRLVTTTLSKHFYQDWGRGVWNLSEADCLQLPLRGWWAAERMRSEWEGPTDDFATWQDQQADLFARVGAAFADARGNRELACVVTDAKIAAALRAIGDNNPALRRVALESFIEDMKADARTIRETKEQGIAEHLFATFEMGGVGVHLAAGADLYIACANLYRVNAAALSRGRLGSGGSSQ